MEGLIERGREDERGGSESVRGMGGGKERGMV